MPAANAEGQKLLLLVDTKLVQLSAQPGGVLLQLPGCSSNVGMPGFWGTTGLQLLKATLKMGDHNSCMSMCRHIPRYTWKSFKDVLDLLRIAGVSEEGRRKGTLTGLTGLARREEQHFSRQTSGEVVRCGQSHMNFWRNPSLHSSGSPAGWYSYHIWSRRATSAFVKIRVCGSMLVCMEGARDAALNLFHKFMPVAAGIIFFLGATITNLC